MSPVTFDITKPMRALSNLYNAVAEPRELLTLLADEMVRQLERTAPQGVPVGEYGDPGALRKAMTQRGTPVMLHRGRWYIGVGNPDLLGDFRSASDGSGSGQHLIAEFLYGSPKGAQAKRMPVRKGYYNVTKAKGQTWSERREEVWKLKRTELRKRRQERGLEKSDEEKRIEREVRAEKIRQAQAAAKARSRQRLIGTQEREKAIAEIRATGRKVGYKHGKRAKISQHPWWGPVTGKEDLTIKANKGYIGIPVREQHRLDEIKRKTGRAEDKVRAAEERAREKYLADLNRPGWVFYKEMRAVRLQGRHDDQLYYRELRNTYTAWIKENRKLGHIDEIGRADPHLIPDLELKFKGEPGQFRYSTFVAYAEEARHKRVREVQMSALKKKQTDRGEGDAFEDRIDASRRDSIHETETIKEYFKGERQRIEDVRKALMRLGQLRSVKDQIHEYKGVVVDGIDRYKVWNQELYKARGDLFAKTKSWRGELVRARNIRGASFRSRANYLFAYIFQTYGGTISYEDLLKEPKLKKRKP